MPSRGNTKVAKKYPYLEFVHSRKISKKTINNKLHSLDKEFGIVLMLEKAEIRPDGGITWVKDDNEIWRIVLVSEAKYQGKDIENIKSGLYVGKHKDQILMAAGNAIERAHKNIDEIANYMLDERYFPYLLFLEGSNFLTHNLDIRRPDGSIYTLHYDNGTLNRIDRLTAANYGMQLNKNLCENKFISVNDISTMLQAASIYSPLSGYLWNHSEMVDIMFEVAEESLRLLGSDLFSQITNQKNNR